MSTQPYRSGSRPSIDYYALQVALMIEWGAQSKYNEDDRPTLNIDGNTITVTWPSGYVATFTPQEATSSR